MTGSIITPQNDDMGIIPKTNNYGQIGSSSKKFYRMYTTTLNATNVYGTNIYEGNTNISSIYNKKIKWMRVKFNVQSNITVSGLASLTFKKTGWSESVYRPLCYTQYETESWGFFHYPFMIQWPSIYGTGLSLNPTSCFTEDATENSYRSSTNLYFTAWVNGPSTALTTAHYIYVAVGYLDS